MDPLGKKHMSAWLRVDGRMACLLLTIPAGDCSLRAETGAFNCAPYY